MTKRRTIQSSVFTLCTSVVVLVVAWILSPLESPEILGRWYAFRTEIIIFFVIGLIACLALRGLRKKWVDKTKDNSQRDERLKLVLVPFSVVAASCLEETLFRGPLILAFDAMSFYSWIAIVISAILFGSCHMWNHLRESWSLKFTRKGMTKAIEEFKERHKEVEWWNIEERVELEMKERKWGTIHVLMSFLLGLLVGSIAIISQSLVLPIAIHALFNLRTHVQHFWYKKQQKK